MNQWYRRWGKRLFDLLIAIPAFLILLPVMGIIALVVRIRLGTPVIFRQQRPGWRGKPFILYKFRTMTEERDVNGALLPDAQRLTPLGRFLRKTSLDELPELVNVIAGEMSLVGPRPLLMSYLDRYTLEQFRRHEVRPGITGWAQINGRQTIPFSRRLELDVWYVDHLSFGLDLRILALTIPRSLQSQGVVLGQEVEEVDDIGLFARPPSYPSPEKDATHDLPT